MPDARAGDARRVVVLGSTGSVGTQALDVIRNHRDRYEVVALAAGRSSDMLEAQRAEFGVPRESTRLCADNPEALAELAAHPDADVVLNAVVGFAGLPATIAALEAGTRLALANKESLIAAGPVVAKARAMSGAEIVPVDSEHSAVWQCLRAGRGRAIVGSVRRDRLDDARHAHLRAARPRHVPLPEPRVPSRADRRHRACGAERGQRGRGGSIPRRAALVVRDRRGRRRSPER